MEFIEFAHFAKALPLIGSDDDYLKFQLYLMEQPAAGDIIPGSGGLRKLRWAGSGRGKRGGLRIIYYYLTSESQILLLHAFAKNEMEDLPASLIKELKNQVEEHLP